MRNASTVRFQLVTLPDSILAKLIHSFRLSDSEISAALVDGLSREARRRASHGFAAVEIVLPLVSAGDIFDAKAALLTICGSMLQIVDAEQDSLESPSGYRLAAEFIMEIVHSLERMELELKFSAVNTIN